MEVALIEYSDDNLAEQFEKEVVKQAETVHFQYKKSSDLLNVLAFATSLSDKVDYIVIIAELENKKELNNAFYDGLGDFQVQTGKQVFKLLSEPGEGIDIIEFANEFLDVVFERKRPKETAKDEDLLDVV